LDLFDKCQQFAKMLAAIKAQDRFYYCRSIEPAAGTVAKKNGRELINLGSNNYLGLTEHPKVKEAARAAIERYGTGSAGSRLLTGTTPLHLEMERRLARFKGTEDTVSFSTGFMTLDATVSSLAGEGEFIFSDELNHASIINGCRSSQAKTVVYRHNDPSDLEEKLKAVPPDAAKLIVTDGVFSMEGDVCRLPDLSRLARDFNCRLMVDDAHSTGVLGRTGRGTAEHFDLEGKVDVVSGTLSKTFAAIGGFTCSQRVVTDFIRYSARQSIFSASLPPSVCATVLAVLDILESDPGLVRRLHSNTRFILDRLQGAGFKLKDSGTPIIPILIGDDDKAYQMAGRLEEEGVFANPVVHPAVPRGKAIIRISLMASHTEPQLAVAASMFEKVGRQLGVI